MTRDKFRYVGNALIGITALTALYLIFAHRYDQRPFDYLWQGYVCPTNDFVKCAKNFEPALMNVHYVDREVCKDQTELEMSVEKVAQKFPDVTIDVGFMYGCRRSTYHRSELTSAQLLAGSVVDDSALPTSPPDVPPVRD